MLITLCLGLLGLQGVQTSLPPASPIGPRVRSAVPTLEGAPGSAVLGLFDRLTGEFIPERLSGQVTGWTALTPAPLDFSGRTEITSGLAHEPRWRQDVAGGSRVELPSGGGTLFHLRGVYAGASRFAIVHVSREGVPRIVIDRPALVGGQSPFLPKLGVDPGGTGVLIGTRREAGGDLFDADLVSRTIDLRTASLPPLELGVDGLWLGDTWGFGVAASGPMRFLRRPQAQAALVPVQGGQPATWRGDAAVSRAWTGAVAIGGAGQGLWMPYVFGLLGPAHPAAQAPGNLSPAGYAPESTFGPFLALADDGETVGWRVETGSGPTAFRDVWVGRASAQPVASIASGDAQIVDTVNEIGRILPSPTGGILFAVGEDNDPTEGGLEGAEILRAVMDAGGSISLQNVTQTSGDTTLPLFDQSVPTWTPARFVLLTPTVALIHDDDAKALVALDLEQSTRWLVLADVREVYWIESAGAPGRAGAWVAAIERDDAQRRQQIVAAGSALSSAVVLDQGSPTVEFRAPTAWRGANHAVAYIRHEFGLEHLDVIQPAGLSRTRWSVTPGTFQPPIAFLGPRTLAFSRQAGGLGAEQRLWSFRGTPMDRALSGTIRPSLLLH